jgi:hypothetical protein
MMTIKIVLNDKGTTPGKLADAELHFGPEMADPAYGLLCDLECAGEGRVQMAPDLRKRLQEATAAARLHPLAGLKLIGFSVWERRGGGRNVTFPARQYSINGERRSFALLRPVGDLTASDGVRDAILAAYDAAAQEASS